MKLILSATYSLILSISVFGQSTTASDSLKKEFDYYFKVLNKAARESKIDTIYCCQVSADFMERYTYIQTGTMGNMLGRYGFTKEALTQWHEWYVKKYGRMRNKKSGSI